MADAEEEDNNKAGWQKVVIGGAIVALISGMFPLATAYLSEDLTRCDLATEFLIGFSNQSLYTEEELAMLKAVYIDAATSHCVGE